jgi:hypothetical protein
VGAFRDLLVHGTGHRLTGWRPPMDMLPAPAGVGRHPGGMIFGRRLTAHSGTGGAVLLRALGSLQADLVGGPVRLDGNHAAIVSTELVRLGAGGTEEFIPHGARRRPDLRRGPALDLPADGG